MNPKRGTYEILFRQLNDPVPSWSVPGLRWAIELWFYDTGHPAAQAWVMDVAGLNDGVGLVYLDWLEVNEPDRRQGLGTALLEACITKWPNLEYDGATDAGEAFCDAFDLTHNREMPS